MHPRQAALLANAAELTDKLAAKKQTQQKQVAAVPSTFFEYTDEDGNSFYLPKKMTTVRSPYTGKSMTGQKPTPIKPGQFGAELKEQKEKANKDKSAAVKTEADFDKLQHQMRADLDTFDLAWSRYDRDPEKNAGKLNDALKYMNDLRDLADVLIRNMTQLKKGKTASTDAWKA